MLCCFSWSYIVSTILECKKTATGISMALYCMGQLHCATLAKYHVPNIMFRILQAKNIVMDF